MAVANPDSVNSEHLAALVELAALLKASLDDTPSDKRAPLAAQYRAVLAEVAQLQRESGRVADPVDEIAARRVARGGATARPRVATGGPS